MWYSPANHNRTGSNAEIWLYRCQVNPALPDGTSKLTCLLQSLSCKLRQFICQPRFIRSQTVEVVVEVVVVVQVVVVYILFMHSCVVYKQIYPIFCAHSDYIDMYDIRLYLITDIYNNDMFRLVNCHFQVNSRHNLKRKHTAHKR
jgi:hypothetical protein